MQLKGCVKKIDKPLANGVKLPEKAWYFVVVFVIR